MVIYQNAKHFIDANGIDRVGFLTITPRDHLIDRVEASRRFHSLATHVLDVRYLGGWMRVFERMDSGRIHYHCLIACSSPIRPGLDFEQVARKVYRSANPVLRAEWAFWRETAPKYGWGRCELLPIRTNAEGAARYVGKYVSKHLGVRKHEDKAAQLFGCSSGARAASMRFTWNTPAGFLWRRKLAVFARDTGCSDLESVKQRFGPDWGYKFREAIQAIRLDPGFEYPTAAHALADGVILERDLEQLVALGVDLYPVTVATEVS